MRTAIILSFLLVICSGIAAQEKIWTTQTKIAEVINYEKKDKRSQFPDYDIILPVEYYPDAFKHRVTKPFIVQRAASGYLPVNAQYYFTPADSLLRFVSYEWAKRFDDPKTRQQQWDEEDKKLAAYNKEYERIKKILLAQLGVATESDTKPTEGSATRGNYYTRNTVWDNEKIHATLSMTFASMTYSIKMMLYWKK